MIEEKTYQIKILTLLILVSVLGFAACSLNLDDNQTGSISQEDIEAVSLIMGEALSDENGGIIGSFYDAITEISNEGFVRSLGIVANTGGHDQNTGRGSESNLNYRYNPEKGQHELSFERLVNTTIYRKQVTDTLKYIYTDQQGNFIENIESILNNSSAIQYSGSRVGEIETSVRSSFFSRNDTFLINGVEGTSSELKVDGVHRGKGFFKSTKPIDNSTFERTYELEINFLNISINKAVIEQNISLEQGVRGSLTYVLVIEDPNNRSVSRTIKGTMDFVGDGTATLRFNKVASIYQVNLDNGTVNNQDSEFEGRITSVNLSQSMFTLASGLIVEVNEKTSISPESDLFTLEAVYAALQTTPYVRAEGEGSITSQIFRASDIEFELDEDNDDENDELEFEKHVQSVDLNSNTFTLEDGTLIGFDGESMIDLDGDYINLSEVANALSDGIIVLADGDARYIESGPFNYIVNEVEFETGEEGDDSETGSINFEGFVQSVDLTLNTLNLDNGAVIQISSETVIDGDLSSLQAVQNAITAGQKIKTSGKGIDNPENEAIDLVAIEIEFNIED